jgi:hypothetical protein
MIAYCYPHAPAKFAQFARRIFQVKFTDDVKAAKQGLSLLTTWLRGVGLYQTLTDVGIDDSKFDDLANDTLALYGDKNGHIDSHQLIDRRGILEIYRSCL